VGKKEGERSRGADMWDRATRERGSARAGGEVPTGGSRPSENEIEREEARLGLLTWAEGGCWPAGKREKRERGKWAARGRKPVQEEGGRDGLRVRREGKRDGLPG
jgi:hypothetical protein